MKGERAYCRLTIFHLFRCQLRRCGLDPERINWRNHEERTMARECLKALYSEKEWKRRGLDYYKCFYKNEERRRHYRRNRQIFSQIRKARIYGKNKKLSWLQIYEIVHGLVPKGGCNGTVGLRTFMGEVAIRSRFRRYGLNRRLILSMSLDEFKNYITEKKLELKLGKDWKNILYQVWRDCKYSQTPAEGLLHELEIKRKHWIGRPFEHFLDLIKSQLWEMECGKLSRRKKYAEGYKKQREEYSIRYARDWLQVREIFNTCGLRHALLTMRKGLLRMVKRHFGSIRNVTEEEFSAFLEVRIARMRRKRDEAKVEYASCHAKG